MVYISKDGAVRDTPPFMTRLTNFLWGILNFIVLFFQTMIPGLNSGFGSSITGGSSRGGDGGGGGGGGGGSRGSGHKAFPSLPKRSMGRIGRMSDIPPPPACGGCGCG